MGPPRRRRPTRLPHETRRRDRRRRPRPRQGRDRRQWLAVRGDEPARAASRGQQHPLLRKFRTGPPERRRPGPHPPRRRAQPRPLRPGRRRCRLDPVERAVHARDLAGRAGARSRRHSRAEAARVGAADVLDARRPRRAGRPAARRPQRRPWHGRRRRRPAHGTQGRRPGRVHGIAGDRPHRLPRRRREPHAGVVRARRQVAVHRVRGRRPRRGSRNRRLPVRQLRPGVPRRHAPAGATRHRRRRS